MLTNKKVEHCWNLACGLGLPVAATMVAMVAMVAGAGAAVPVASAMNSEQADTRITQVQARAQIDQQQLDQQQAELLAILDAQCRLPTTALGPDGEVTTTAPLFTDEDRAIAAKAGDSDDPLTRALAALIEGDTAGARAELAKVTNPADHTADYSTAMGDSYSFEQRFDEALPQYERALHIPGDTPTPRAFLNLASALLLASGGNTATNAPRAIELYTRIIELPEVTTDWVATALRNRGVALGQQGRPDEEIADYTRVIDLEGAPVEQVASAFVNRGIAHGRQGRIAEAIADLDRVIDLPGAPARQVAKALRNRGFAHGLQGRPAAAIADWTRVIDLPGAPVEQVAMALYDRGAMHHQQGRLAEAIADYTRVIELDGAPVDQVASALYNRGLAHGDQGRPAKEIADYTRVIELDGAPVGLVAEALYNRGVLRGDNANTKADACADYARAARLYASLGNADMQGKAEQQRQSLGCDD